MNFEKIIVDIIIILSVAACILYFITLQKKNASRRAGQAKGLFIDKCAAQIKYNSETISVCMNFYTDGVVFEKENSDKLFIPGDAIRAIDRADDQDAFVYHFEFEPVAGKTDSFDIISQVDMEKYFSYILPEEKE